MNFIDRHLTALCVFIFIYLFFIFNRKSRMDLIGQRKGFSHFRRLIGSIMLIRRWKRTRKLSWSPVVTQVSASPWHSICTNSVSSCLLVASWKTKVATESKNWMPKANPPVAWLLYNWTLPTMLKLKQLFRPSRTLCHPTSRWVRVLLFHNFSFAYVRNSMFHRVCGLS